VQQALTMTEAGIVVSQIFVGLTVRSDRLSIVTLGLRSSGRMLAAQALSLLLLAADEIRKAMVRHGGSWSGRAVRH
jgi:hypothetical protein